MNRLLEFVQSSLLSSDRSALSVGTALVAACVAAAFCVRLVKDSFRTQNVVDKPLNQDAIAGPSYMLGIGAVLTYCRFLLMGIPEAASYYALNYGDFVRVWIAGKPTLLITRPSIVAHILKSNKYTLRFGNADGLQRIGMLHNGIIWNCDVGKWKMQRSHFQKALNADALKASVEIAVEATERVLSLVPVLQQSHPDGRIEALDLLRRITLDVVNNLALKADIDDDEDLVRRIVNYFKAWEFFLIKPSWTYVLFDGYKEHMKSVRSLNEAIAELVEKRRRKMNDFDPLTLDEGDFAETLLRDESEGKLSAEDVRQCILEMILAGTDTSSVTVFYLLIALANHPDIEDRLLAELDDVLGDRPMTWHDLPKLVHLENSLKESMRIRPVGPVILRSAISDDLLDGAQLIPKGTQIVLNIAHMHRKPDLFPDPDVFDPNRFHKKEFQPAFYPFGTGPKGCIGQFLAMVEMKAILATFLRRYKVVPCSNETLETLETRWDIAQQPQKPSYMLFTKRASAVQSQTVNCSKL